MSEAVILPHHERPGEPGWKMLAGFPTGRDRFPTGPDGMDPVHRDWLDRHAVEALRAGHWVFLRGYASRLGRDERLNLDLSNRRAHRVATYLLRQRGVRADHITAVEAVGESVSTGGENDNSARWRAVEITITPQRRVVDLPEIRIEGRIPNRFRMAVLGSMSAGPITSIRLVIRDDLRAREAIYRLDMLGLSIAPGNLGGRGRWHEIPNDPRVTGLGDFDRAEALLGSIDQQRSGSRRGPRVSVSAAFLRMRLRDLRARRINISNFDTGSSILPDMGGSVGDMRQFPPGDFAAGSFGSP